MATISDNKHKKSFWQRAFGREEEPVTPEPTQAEEPAEEVAEQAPPQPELPEPEDIVDRAARLADEEVLKRQWADVAVAEAERAEAARRHADIEAALKLAETKAEDLKRQSAAAQEAAAAALEDLSAAEQAYSEALRMAEDKRAEIKAVSEQGEQDIAALTAENEERLGSANQRIAAMAKEIKERRLAADAAIAAGRDAEIAMEEVEAELRRLTNEGNEEIRRNLKKIDEIKAETQIVEKQMVVYEARLQSEQQSFDKAARDLAEIEQNRLSAREKIQEVRARQQELSDNRQAQLDSLREAHQSRLSAAEEELASHRQRCEENKKLTDLECLNAEDLDKRRHEAEQQLRALNRERDEAERQAREQIADIMSRIEAAKQDVADKKNLYQEAQKKVESATSKLVKANAQAKSARDKADRAVAEENDARIATEMAQRLRSDATAARSATDESSALLMDRAESVLLATIQSTNDLLEEKRAKRAAADEEAAARQEEANIAADESAAATAAANDMIVVWLAAEESFVRITGEVEADKQQVEMKLMQLLQDYEQRCEDTEKEVQRLSAEVEQARQRAEAATREWREASAVLASTEEQIAELRRAGEEEEEKLREQLDGELSEVFLSLEKEEAGFAKLEQDYNYLHAAHDQSALVLSDKLNECNSERERLRQLLTEKQGESAQLEAETAELENKYKEQLAALKERVEETEGALKQHRENAAQHINEVEELERNYAEACADLETIEKSCAEALEAARQRLSAQLTPLNEASRNYDETALVLSERLNEKRGLAELSVRAAAEVFTERLTAANEVSRKLAENEIARIKEDSIPIYKKAEETKQILEQAEAEHARLEADAERLRAEEESINAEADEKYRQLDISTAAALKELEKKLRERIKEEDGNIKEAMSAEQALEEAQRNRSAVQLTRDEATQQAAAVAAMTADKLRSREEEYQAAVNALYAGIPELEEEAQSAEAMAEEQLLAMEESEADYNEQAQVVEEKLRLEISAPQLAAARIEELKAGQQSRLNEVKTRLAALEAKQTELQTSFDAGSDYAAKSDHARISVEEYYNKLLKEQEDAERNAAEEISAIEARLAVLRDDATEKEQRFRDTERTLLNSSELISAAEKRHEDAQIASAKALAELQSSQAAKETATALAQQASIARENMDRSTADILMKAAEGLFSAVDNATAVIQEKQAAYDQAELALKETEQELEEVRISIGEAPAQLEQSRHAWQKAEDIYRKFKDEADKKIPQIRESLDNFLKERHSDVIAAGEAVARCREEAASAREGVEKLSRQLMINASEISLAAVDVQTAEIQSAEAVTALEDGAELELSRAQQERAQAEELLERLAERLAERREHYQLARERAEEKTALWQQRNAAYQAELQSLTDSYQQDIAKAKEAEQQVVDEAEAAEQELAKAVAAETEAAAAYTQIKISLSAASELRERLTRECEEMRRNRDRLLKSAEEEKLRRLGTKTIERINAEERASSMLTECLMKRNISEAAAKQVKEVEEELRIAEEKWENICQESEKAINLAKSKTAAFAAK